MIAIDLKFTAPKRRYAACEFARVALAILSTSCQTAA